MNRHGCGRKLAPGQYFSRCGDREMGDVVGLCTECGGPAVLAEQGFKPTMENFQEVVKALKWMHTYRDGTEYYIRAEHILNKYEKYLN